ncbi:uncharacterized protein TNCV_2772761 [Trichonephila clavipes]|nr:uncharacterized protein TNCV_2772761 [Trichonephila clavipes]
MANKRKHSTLTLKDKLEVLKRLDKGEGVTKLATEFNVGKASVGDINEWMEEDGETAEFLTDDDIAAAVTQEPMEEEGSDDETQCDKKDVVPHADGEAALDLVLRYLEQQPDTTQADVLFIRRWRNYASSKRLSSLRQKKITELMLAYNDSSFENNTIAPINEPDLFARETVHHIRCTRLVGDDDSNTIAKCRERISYGGRILKVECANHAVRRYDRAIQKLQGNTTRFSESACRKKSTPCSKLVIRIVYGRDLCNAAMKYGLANEEIARKQYEREYSTEVKICGLFVDKDKPFCVLPPMDWLVMMDS